MRIKIATWNMGHWQHSEKAKQAWDYLDKTIAPDIALVQEAVPISEQMGFIGLNTTNQKSLISTERIIWQEIGGNRKWGSGVLTKSFPLREVRFQNSYPGSVIAGEIMLPDVTTLTSISLYGMIDQHGYSTTTLHRILSDLNPLLRGKMGKRQIVLGGDFNASLQWDEVQGDSSHKIFFERLHDFDLVDCLEKFHSGRLQTLRHGKSDVPWQNDYIFASTELIGSLISCDVVNEPAVHELSDHNPVVAVFDIN
jgi:exodeoxyribonuclease-3